MSRLLIVTSLAASFAFGYFQGRLAGHQAGLDEAPETAAYQREREQAYRDHDARMEAERASRAPSVVECLDVLGIDATELLIELEDTYRYEPSDYGDQPSRYE